MPSPVSSARGLVLACHPLPSVAVTVLLAGLVLQAGPSLTRGLLATAAVFVGQLSIGWCNDARDAERDRAVGRRDKPVATGLVSPRTTAAAAGLALILAAALSAPLGLPPCLVVMAGVAAGWAYDLVVKETALSAVPFAIAFGSLPAVATLTAHHDHWPAAWAVIAAGLFGVAAHFANVLPDLLDDEATGVRGLPHRLGSRATAVIGPTLLAGASAVILLVPGGGHPALRAVALGSTAAVAAVGAAAGLRRPGSRMYFLSVIAVAALDLACFGLSGASLE